MTQQKHKIYKIASEFTKTPGPRYICEGEYSGELFRVEHLAPEFSKAVTEGYVLVVDLDGTAGYGTSFLEEAFGGLIRNNKYSIAQLEIHLDFISTEEPYLLDDIKGDIYDASKEKI